MKQLLAYKYRIYPTEEQQILLSKTFGCKRVIFNHYLNEQQERFKNKEKHLSNYDINKDITKLKESKEWLREVDSIALQMAAEDLSVAYENFFKSVTGKRKGPKIALPKFKTKHSRQSYRTRGLESMKTVLCRSLSSKQSRQPYIVRYHPIQQSNQQRYQRTQTEDIMPLSWLKRN